MEDGVTDVATDGAEVGGEDAEVGTDTEVVDTAVTEVVDTVTAEIVDAVATEIVDAVATEIVDTVATGIVEAVATEIVDTVGTEIVDGVAAEIVEIVAAEIVDAEVVGTETTGNETEEEGTGTGSVDVGTSDEVTIVATGLDKTCGGMTLEDPVEAGLDIDEEFVPEPEDRVQVFTSCTAGLPCASVIGVRAMIQVCVTGPEGLERKISGATDSRTEVMTYELIVLTVVTEVGWTATC